MWKQFKKLERRVEENEPALRFQILGLKSAKDEIEEARLEFKSYVVNQGNLIRWEMTIANAFTVP